MRAHELLLLLLLLLSRCCLVWHRCCDCLALALLSAGVACAGARAWRASVRARVHVCASRRVGMSLRADRMEEHNAASATRGERGRDTERPRRGAHGHRTKRSGASGVRVPLFPLSRASARSPASCVCVACCGCVLVRPAAGCSRRCRRILRAPSSASLRLPRGLITQRRREINHSLTSPTPQRLEQHTSNHDAQHTTHDTNKERGGRQGSGDALQRNEKASETAKVRSGFLKARQRREKEFCAMEKHCMRV